MYTEPKIVISEELTKRGYIIYYFNGLRQREYNGKRLNLKINPNYCKSYNERLKLLKKLQYEFTKALEAGWNPLIIEKVKVVKPLTLREGLDAILKEKLESPLSQAYKRDLQKVLEQFIAFTPPKVLAEPASELDNRYVELFLNQFNSSATYYMNKRRNLGVFFSELERTRQTLDNPVRKSLRKKEVSRLHKVYSRQQMLAVLEYLDKHNRNLHLCCLLAYGCFLRPHQEIRLLTVDDLNENCSVIALSGAYNKSKRVRVVNTPLYVQELLKKRVEQLLPTDNLLSGRREPFNVCYLNTMWSRAKKKMLALGILQPDQTIYSFRHTAAVNVYRSSKDLNILKSLLGHSNMIVTLKYLRSLGEMDLEEQKAYLPEL